MWVFLFLSSDWVACVFVRSIEGEAKDLLCQITRRRPEPKRQRRGDLACTIRAMYGKRDFMTSGLAHLSDFKNKLGCPTFRGFRKVGTMLSTSSRSTYLRRRTAHL